MTSPTISIRTSLGVISDIHYIHPIMHWFPFPARGSHAVRFYGAALHVLLQRLVVSLLQFCELMCGFVPSLDLWNDEGSMISNRKALDLSKTLLIIRYKKADCSQLESLILPTYFENNLNNGAL